MNSAIRIFHSNRPGRRNRLTSRLQLRWTSWCGVAATSRPERERLRYEAHLTLAVLDAGVHEDADERAEEAVARAEAPLPARRLHQPATNIRQQVLGDRVEIAAHEHNVPRPWPQAGDVGERKLPERRRLPDRALGGGHQDAQLRAEAPRDADAELLVPEVIDDLGPLHPDGDDLAGLLLLQGQAQQDPGREAGGQLHALGRSEEILRADAHQQLAIPDGDPGRARGRGIGGARPPRAEQSRQNGQHRGNSRRARSSSARPSPSPGSPRRSACTGWVRRFGTLLGVPKWTMKRRADIRTRRG